MPFYSCIKTTKEQITELQSPLVFLSPTRSFVDLLKFEVTILTGDK